MISLVRTEQYFNRVDLMVSAERVRNHNISKKPGDTDVYIGGRLRLWRRTMDIDACVLAERIGVTYQQLQKYEKGMNRISAARLYAISKELDVPIEYFYMDAEGEAHSPDTSVSAEGGTHKSDQFAWLTDGNGADVLKHYLTIPKPEVRKALLALMRTITSEDPPKT